MVQKLDSTNLSRMKEALRSGFPLPPIVASKEDNRIIDGFHRVKATLDVFGDDADIEVQYREYETEPDKFLDAGLLNMHQGLTLSPQDRAYFIYRCRQMKIPPLKIAEALHMDVEKMKTFLKERTAKTQNGDTIALPYGVAKALHGKTLTRAQEHCARTTNGSMVEQKISMLINALSSGSVVLTAKTITRLKELRDIIDKVLDEEAAS